MTTIFRRAMLMMLMLPLTALAQVEVTVEALDAAASEAGPDAAVFRFTRTGSTASALRVNTSFDPTTTVVSADYADNNGGRFRSFGEVDIPAGESQLDLVITPTPDNLVEGEEQLDISLIDGSYDIGSPASAGIVITDDPPVVTVTALTGTASEAGTAATFRFQRTGGQLGAALRVNVSFDPTTTAVSTDYADSNGGRFRSFGQVDIPAGESQVDLVITPTPDNLVEGDERLDITLTDGSYDIGSPASAGIVITDDAPEVSVTALIGTASEAGMTGTFRFQRTGGQLDAALRVNVSFDPTTTAVSTDYADSNGGRFRTFGQVDIPTGDSQFDIVITPTPDNLVEGDEQLDITLTDGSYIIASPDSAGIVITDDAPEVTLTVASAIGIEGGEPAILRFTRTGGSSADSLSLSTLIDPSSTATTQDYTDNNGGRFSTFGDVFIAANESDFDLELSAVVDEPIEGDETLTVILDNGSYLIGDTSIGTVTFTEGPIFEDGFEGSVVPGPANKACAISKISQRLSHRFHSQGASIMDTETNLVWLRCAVGERYDWRVQRCANEASIQQAPDVDSRQRLLQNFNWGATSDNLGFDDWRWANEQELDVLGLAGQLCGVR